MWEPFLISINALFDTQHHLYLHSKLSRNRITIIGNNIRYNIREILSALQGGLSMKDFNDMYVKLKQIISTKKMRATMYVVAVLWIAVLTQVFMNRFYEEDIEITQAFINTNSGELKSGIEMVAEYQEQFLSELEKKEIIQYIADKIGLDIDKEIQVLQDGEKTEYSFTKQAKYATSQLKVVSMEEKIEEAVKVRHYIIVRLTIKDSIYSMDKYSTLIEEALRELGMKDINMTLQYEGSFQGELSANEKDRIAHSLVEELHGITAIKYNENDLYLVYAYTGLIPEYTESLGTKINIQIEVTYDELTDKTKVYMATPILQNNW